MHRNLDEMKPEHNVRRSLRATRFLMSDVLVSAVSKWESYIGILRSCLISEIINSPNHVNKYLCHIRIKLHYKMYFEKCMLKSVAIYVIINYRPDNCQQLSIETPILKHNWYTQLSYITIIYLILSNL